MPQKLEKLYGSRAIVSRHLDPRDLSSIDHLQEEAENIRSIKGYSPDEFLVYFHKLSIQINEDHFAHRKRLSERLRLLRLSFRVSLRVQPKAQIKLYHFALPRNMAVHPHFPNF
jgi:hypothetical protein